MKRLALLALSLTPLAALPANAQVTPERAASLQQQIRDWFQSTLGPDAPIARDPITVTAVGDHFDVSAPLASGADAPSVTGKMTDAGDGRWAVDAVALPSPSTFRHQLPMPKTPGAVGGEAVTTVTIGQQQQRMLIDPTFRTPTTWTSGFENLDFTTQLPQGRQSSHINSMAGSSTLTPTMDGRVDVALSSSGAGYSTKMVGGSDRQPAAITIGKLSVIANLTSMSRERGGEILRLLVRSGQPSPEQTGTGSVGHQTVLALAGALSDLASGAKLAEEVEDLTVSVGTMTGSLARASLGLDTAVDAGKLRARLLLDAAGLVLPDVGLGTLAPLIPNRLALTPVVSAVPTDAAQRLFRRAIEKTPPTNADLAALFSQGPIEAGIDDIHLDLSGSKIGGSLRLLASSPSALSGAGQITAEDIDRLQQAMMADPQAAQIAPLLIFLKGIGRTEQNRTVWDLVYQEGRLLVNGQDMAALLGAAMPQRPTAPRSGGSNGSPPHAPVRP